MTSFCQVAHKVILDINVSAAFGYVRGAAVSLITAWLSSLKSTGPSSGERRIGARTRRDWRKYSVRWHVLNAATYSASYADTGTPSF
jgi:hypothetical protein